MAIPRKIVPTPAPPAADRADSMSEEERVIAREATPAEERFEQNLRPQTLADYIGQEKIKAHLRIAMEAAAKRKEALEHVLLYGNPGLGKTTLAHVIARELGVNIRVTSGPAIERTGDLAAILSNLEPGDILFIDEIHRLSRTVEEVLYPAMEEYALDLVIGKGPAARMLRLDIPRFTLIGATTRASALSAPLRDRFGMSYHLNFYEDEDIEKILARSASILGAVLTSDAGKLIASRSRWTPRVANRILRRVRDYVQVHSNGVITNDQALKALELLEIDALGLDHVDRRILDAIISKFGGGPVGLSTLAASSAEEIDTIEEMIEPFLLQLGLIDRTPRGRIATDKAYEHLGVEGKGGQQRII